MHDFFNGYCQNISSLKNNCHALIKNSMWDTFNHKILFEYMYPELFFKIQLHIYIEKMTFTSEIQRKCNILNINHMSICYIYNAETYSYLNMFIYRTIWNIFFLTNRITFTSFDIFLLLDHYIASLMLFVEILIL